MEIYSSQILAFSDLYGIELIEAGRRKRIGRYRMHADKARCLVAGLLLRFVLGDKVANICTNAYGKPYLPGETIEFNLSHSEDYVVIAVDDQPVGIDIEKVRKRPMAVAKRCCQEEELQWLSAQTDQSSAFYKLWTGKESIVKAVGCGLSLSPQSFSILPMEASSHRVADRDWYLHWYPFENYQLCTASVGNKPVKIRVLTKEELTM